MSDSSERPPPKNPIATSTFLQQVPSTRVSPLKALEPPHVHQYEIRVQRRETGRWNQVGRFTVSTTETDMIGPLRMGLKDNYRVLITEEGLGGDTKDEDVNER